jgi:hypothetical protein
MKFSINGSETKCTAAFFKREVVFVSHVAPVIDEDLLVVTPALAFLILIEMIGEIGGQTLGPIACLPRVKANCGR